MNFLDEVDLTQALMFHAQTASAKVDARTWLRRYFDCGNDLVTLTDDKGVKHDVYSFDSYLLELDNKANPVVIYGVKKPDHTTGRQQLVRFQRKVLI